MPAEASLVRSLLKDVALEGVVLIEKRKLLWMIGWLQERRGAWDDLLGFWQEMGQERDTLCGLEAHGKILLCVKAPKLPIGSISEWTSRT